MSSSDFKTAHFCSSKEVDNLKINTKNISVTRSGKSAHILYSSKLVEPLKDYFYNQNVKCQHFGLTKHCTVNNR